MRECADLDHAGTFASGSLTYTGQTASAEPKSAAMAACSRAWGTWSGLSSVRNDGAALLERCAIAKRTVADARHTVDIEL